MSIDTMLTFSLAFLVFAASPGPDNITIVSRTMSHGPASGAAYGLGVVTSIVMFVILAAIGFNAISLFLNENLRVVQYAAAAYLVYMGVSMWRSDQVSASRTSASGVARLFFLGFLLNVSNPKMPVFYLALLPAVMGVNSLGVTDVASLILVILLIEVLVVGGHVFMAYRARAVLRDPRSVKLLNRGAGSIMIGAGLLVASR
jgi:threonine/homoserine/homoserine lactone efflux protein